MNKNSHKNKKKKKEEKKILLILLNLSFFKIAESENKIKESASADLNSVSLNKLQPESETM